MPRVRISDEDKRRNARLRKQKQRAKESLANRERPLSANALNDIIDKGFADFIDENNIDVNIAYEGLHAGGIIVEGDLALEDHRGVYPEDVMWEDVFQVPLNSMNRAIVMIGGMIDAATALAHLVNKYKMQEINRAIEEAKNGNASENEKQKLYALQTRLKRTIKVSMPVYFVDRKWIQ